MIYLRTDLGTIRLIEKEVKLKAQLDIPEPQWNGKALLLCVSLAIYILLN